MTKQGSREAKNKIIISREIVIKFLNYERCIYF